MVLASFTFHIGLFVLKLKCLQMLPAGPPLTLVTLYHIPEGSSLIHSRKYVTCNRTFYVFRQSLVFIREIHSEVYVILF